MNETCETLLSYWGESLSKLASLNAPNVAEQDEIDSFKTQTAQVPPLCEQPAGPVVDHDAFLMAEFAKNPNCQAGSAFATFPSGATLQFERGMVVGRVEAPHHRFPGFIVTGSTSEQPKRPMHALQRCADTDGAVLKTA